MTRPESVPAGGIRLGDYITVPGHARFGGWRVVGRLIDADGVTLTVETPEGRVDFKPVPLTHEFQVRRK